MDVEVLVGRGRKFQQPSAFTTLLY